MFHSIASIQLSSLIKEEHCYSLPGFHKIFLMSFFFSAVIEPVNKISFFFFPLFFQRASVWEEKEPKCAMFTCHSDSSPRIPFDSISYSDIRYRQRF